ncbi:MAG TPA: hypothetical protein PKE07_05735 [Lacibacter sp.]|nr:hypothetical protein [Lacibacter sp.]HMO89030.1 hypothetical protein [Lacibacter sp.]
MTKYLIASAAALFLLAQVSVSQEVLQEGIIHIKVENTPGNDAGGPPPGAPEGAMVMRMGDGEIKTKIMFKNGMSKAETDMGFGTTQMIYDSKTQTTTTLFQAMGRKMGFYTNEEEMKKMMAGADSGRQRMQNFNPDVFIEYLGDTKKIAGMVCNKALIRYKNRRGEEQQQAVWYSPEFKAGENFRMNDMMRMANVPGLNKLKGFPMEFEMTRPNGARTFYQVTKVDLKAKIDDKVFVIPKDYDVKPMSEMNQGGGGRGNFIFRMGN